MKKPKFLNRFNIVDFLIVLCVIGVIGFGLIYVSSDHNSGESVSYDSQTFNKINDKYSSFYERGEIVSSTVRGINASSGENTEVSGEIEWLNIENNHNENFKIIINHNGESLLIGTYKNCPNADIYGEYISLETNGAKYKDVKEITLSGENISSINDLTKGLNNTNYEISTTVTTNQLDQVKIQEAINELFNNHKRISLESNKNNQIEITKATSQEINIINPIIGNIDGQTSQIIIRLYNCSNEDIKNINETYTINNIRDLS